MNRYSCRTIFLFVLFAAFASTPSFAQAEKVPGASMEIDVSRHEPAGFSGPASVPAQVREIESARKKSGLHWPTLPSLDKYGLSIAADYQALFQNASKSPAERNTAAGVARFYGQWTPFGRRTENPGALVFKVEHRHRLGTDITPQDLGSTIGYAGLTALPWSDAGGVLTNLYWHQGFNTNRFAFLAGIVDVTDYVDVFGLVNPWTDFNNYAFSTSPTIPAPNQGVGAAARFSLTPHIYIHGGIADANGDPGDPANSLDSFFNTHEFFKHVEIGWIGSWNNRFTNNAHITVWQVDEREAAGIEDGWGAAFSFSRKLASRWNPFVRGGYSDGGGALYKRMLSAGFGYDVNDRGDFAGFGASWGRAPAGSARGDGADEYTFEAYYRLQLFRHLQITPSIQYLIDPANNPADDDVWVIGMRMRATF